MIEIINQTMKTHEHFAPTVQKRSPSSAIDHLVEVHLRFGGEFQYVSSTEICAWSSVFSTTDVSTYRGCEKEIQVLTEIGQYFTKKDPWKKKSSKEDERLTELPDHLREHEFVKGLLSTSSTIALAYLRALTGKNEEKLLTLLKSKKLQESKTIKDMPVLIELVRIDGFSIEEALTVL